MGVTRKPELLNSDSAPSLSLFGIWRAKLQKSFKIYLVHEAPSARKSVAPGVSPGLAILNRSQPRRGRSESSAFAKAAADKPHYCVSSVPPSGAVCRRKTHTARHLKPACTFL